MTSHEIDFFVRENSATLRAYDWREVESMREELAAVSMSISRHAAAIAQIKHGLNAIQAAMQRAREAKDYQTADALRAIAQAVSQSLA